MQSISPNHKRTYYDPTYPCKVTFASNSPRIEVIEIITIINYNFIDFIFDTKISVPKQSIQYKWNKVKWKLSKKERNNYYILNIIIKEKLVIIVIKIMMMMMMMMTATVIIIIIINNALSFSEICPQMPLRLYHKEYLLHWLV